MAEYGLPDGCDPFPDLCTKVAAIGGTRCEYRRARRLVDMPRSHAARAGFGATAGSDLFGPASAPGSVTMRPSENRSFGGPDTFFRDCSSPTIDDGTEFQAAWFNAMLANLERSVGRGNGQKGDGTNVVIEDNADDSLVAQVECNILCSDR
jgi:hypothetical protein